MRVKLFCNTRNLGTMTSDEAKVRIEKQYSSDKTVTLEWLPATDLNAFSCVASAGSFGAFAHYFARIVPESVHA